MNVGFDDEHGTRRGVIPASHPSLLAMVWAALALFGAVACGDSGGGQLPGREAEARAAEGRGIETWAGTDTQGDNGDGKDRTETLHRPADGDGLRGRRLRHRRRLEQSLRTPRHPEGRVPQNVIGGDQPGDWPCQFPGETDPEMCQVPLSGQVLGDDLYLNHPTDVAFTDGGSFYLAAWHNHKVESYDATTKEVSIVAGQQKPGPAVPPAPAVSDGGPAAKATLNFPSSLVIQSDGSLLLSDEKNNRIRRIGTDDMRTITTVAGSAADVGKNVDGIAATAALLALTASDKLSGSDNPPPGGALALGPDGALYFSDTFHHAIRRINPGADGFITGEADELITTVAGTLGEEGYDGDGGPATSAHLRQPFDVEVHDGGLYIADTENHAVRRVDLEGGDITTIAGTGKPGFSGDGGPATKAKLREPYGLAFDAKGDLYVVDTINDRIRRIAH